jgi:peptidylprolyl isomerase
MTPVRAGDAVKVHFTGRLANGAVFSSSTGDKPLEFAAGTDQIFQGLGEAVLGMRVGERKSFAVPPEAGFGPRVPALQRRVPRAAVPPDARVGDPLIGKSDNPAVRVWVRELRDDYAVVDGNHPLAGQTLEFDIELVSIESGR